MSIENFKIKRSGDFYKRCDKCLLKDKQDREKTKCEHGKQKYFCKICKGQGVCVHNKSVYDCNICKGGNNICEHDRRKSKCKICKGQDICDHDKIKQTCRLCQGSDFCEHDRRKSRCKICKGGSICVHGKRKYICSICGGKGICIHNKIKNNCSICSNGNRKCEHNTNKYTCRLCKGSAVCKHSKIKRSCRDCLNLKDCEHNLVRGDCKYCCYKKKYSKGEQKVMAVLDDLKIDYSYNASFNNLKSNKDYYLRFDFIVYLNSKIYMIEWDGRQHFEPVNYGGRSNEELEEDFKNLQENDKIKNDYCIKNKYPLLRLPYTLLKDNIYFKIVKYLIEY